MGMVFAQDFPHDTGAFFIRLIMLQVQVLHREEHPAVHRFQAVADIGQGPAHNHAHRVIKVRVLNLILNINRDYFFVTGIHLMSAKLMALAIGSQTMAWWPMERAKRANISLRANYPVNCEPISKKTAKRLV